MYKHLYIKSLLICLFTLVMACKKDDQNFKYNKLNEVTIIGGETDLSVTQLDILRIKPELRESDPSGDSYSYQWKIYPQITVEGVPAKILSTAKDLEATIDLEPNVYNLQYKVTNNRNGVSSFQLYTVTVNGKFYEGWLVSATKGTNAQLSFIRSDDELFLSPSETIYHKTYPGKAISAYAGVGTDISLILFFTDRGVYRFNSNDLFEFGTTADLFPSGKTFNTAAAYGINKLLIDQYIISDGALHVSTGPYLSPADALAPYSDRLTGDYHLFPAVISSGLLDTYFYDNKNRRFMHVAYSSRIVEPAIGSGGFNLADVGKTMIACDRGYETYFGDDEFYFVMQDNAGARYLYSLEGSDPVMNQSIGNSPDIGIATAFATSGLVKHMYYAAGNKVYLYDILANSSRLVYTFPAGAVVKDLKMLRSTNRRLIAAVNTGTTGEVFYFDLDNLGAFTGNSYSKKFEGFGEITHLSFRNR